MTLLIQLIKIIKSLFSNMLEKLLLNQPVDPLKFLVNHLKSDRPRARVGIVGPPGAGKTFVADYLASKTGASVSSENDQINEHNGFIIDDITNRSTALQLQQKGHLLDRLIVLDSTDDKMLADRQRGKVKDSITGVHYHPMLNWPTDQKIIDRLEKEATPFDQVYSIRNNPETIDKLEN